MTIALVAKMVTICILLSIVTAWKWKIHQMDVHNAFFTEIYTQKAT